MSLSIITNISNNHKHEKHVESPDRILKTMHHLTNYLPEDFFC